jgi:Amidases related to nicotinamidase
MTSSFPSATALLVIDVQEAFENPAWGARNNPQAEARIADIIGAWRSHGRPVFHVQHVNPTPGSLFNPGSAGVPIKAEARPLPDELLFVKCVNSAFIGTDLEVQLRARGIETLVIVGITTDHCVSTTTRMAGNLGFATYLVSDATATFERTGPDGRHYSASEMHDSALASLHGEFCTVIESSEAIRRAA